MSETEIDCDVMNRLPVDVARGLQFASEVGIRYLVAARLDWGTGVFRAYNMRGINAPDGTYYACSWWGRRWTDFGGQTPIVLDVTDSFAVCVLELLRATEPRPIGVTITSDGYWIGLKRLCFDSQSIFIDLRATIHQRWLCGVAANNTAIALFPEWVRRRCLGDQYHGGHLRR